MNESIQEKNSIESNLKVEETLDADLAVENILLLEKTCFPSTWQYQNAKEYYTDAFLDPQNINLFLHDGNEVVGYVLARPHNVAVTELRKDDPFLTESNDGRYYIETIQVDPDLQGKGGGKKLLLATCNEAQKKGVTRFSIHARTQNHLNQAIKALFKEKVTLVRKIDSWLHAGGEPYEYIEWHI